MCIKPMQKICLRHGFGDAIALAKSTLHPVEFFTMFLCFNAFGNNKLFEVIRQRDEAFDNGSIAFIVQHIDNKTFVDFKIRNRQLFEIGQRGKAGTEIIQRNTDVIIMTLLGNFSGFFHILYGCRFGNFQRQLLGFDVRPG